MDDAADRSRALARERSRRYRERHGARIAASRRKYYDPVKRSQRWKERRQ
jgi:hypothetical protein